MSEQKTARAGVSRRQLIKRGAAVGGLVWAAPVVQSITTPAYAVGSPINCGGCLTGGGKLTTGTYMGRTVRKTTFGLGPLCCDLEPGQQVEVNIHEGNGAADHSFHFDRNLVISCTRTGNAAPPPQTAQCANRFTGTVQDSAGNTLFFDFVDNGEPSTNDTASITIRNASNIVIFAASGFSGGNLQAHPDLGPMKTDCRC